MTLMSILFALACVPSAGDLDVTASNSGDPSGADDTGEEEVEPHFAAGDYEGVLGWWIPDAWDGWVVCELDVDLTVDDEGNFAFDDVCIYKGDSGNYDMLVEFDGVFDDEGEVTGTVVFETWFEDGGWWLEEVEADLEGDTDGEEISFEFWSEIELYGYDYELEGWIELDQ